MLFTTSCDNAHYFVLGLRRTPEESSTICANHRSENAEGGLRYFAALLARSLALVNAP
jgi:hypothetical protein